LSLWIPIFDKAAGDFFCHCFQKKDKPMPAHSLYRYYHKLETISSQRSLRLGLGC
jgi:hypothetical protein